MKKKLTLSLLLASIGGMIVYFTQFYPEQTEAKKLEKLVLEYQNYGNKEAQKELDTFFSPKLRSLAEKGNPAAQFQLGLYYNERGQDILGNEWLTKSANQQFPAAFRELANVYKKKNDLAKYKQYMQDSADLGDNKAKMNLADDAFDNGDYLTAFMLVEQAANADYPMAQGILGAWYFDGTKEIVKMDWEKAFYWLNKSYENSLKHHLVAIFKPLEDRRIRPISVYRELALLNILGVGTKPNDTKAEALLNIHNQEKNEELKLLNMKTRLVIMIKYEDQLDENIKLKADSLLSELEMSQDPAVFISLGNNISWHDIAKAKFYYGKACDLRSQEGCDKYRKLNEEEKGK